MTEQSKEPTTIRGKVLVVDDHASARESVADVLRHVGCDATTCSSGAEALRELRAGSFDVVVTDLQMPGMSGLELIREVERLRHRVQVLMVTAHASVETAVEAMRHGAFDYLEKPYDVDRLEAAVGRALDRKRLQSQAEVAEPASPGLIGSSAVMESLRERIARVAATDETVLIHGESGVGKELIAQTLHAQSSRAEGPMVSLNCPVLSEQLTESELFGHRRGAFTGADADRVGRFELADGGSLLLDEVTEINLGLQAKLLRVLQERAFEKVGSSEIAPSRRAGAWPPRTATWHAEIDAGRFREDLYYRLAGGAAVRRRRSASAGEDVLELADHFLTLKRANAWAASRLTLDAGACDLLPISPLAGQRARVAQRGHPRLCAGGRAYRLEADLMRSWLRRDGRTPPRRRSKRTPRRRCQSAPASRTSKSR